MAEPEHLDIVVVGAGITGINTGYRLQTKLPHKTFAILEARDCIGGTWAFWKYPGIRSDSAMAVFGFSWYPWPHTVNMGQAAQIKTYMEDAAASQGIDKKVRFHHHVASASWSSAEQLWTLAVNVSAPGGAPVAKTIKTRWLVGATGYYSYDKAFPAVIPGIDRFGGQVVHPQWWDDDKVDYADKRVVVIGSGATAITLLPSLAKTAKSVTMLQRSPSFVLALPSKDTTAQTLSRWIPRSWAISAHWWWRIITETLFVQFLLRFPGFGRSTILNEAKKMLPKGYDLDKFNARYNPFEQRLCFCPGGDFFKALNRPNTEVVTDVIDTVTETGILLQSGRTLDADMIVTATGLYLSLLDQLATTVDGTSVNDTMGKRYIWHGVMIEGVPNAGLITGYTAASWTPGADSRALQLIKVIKHADKVGAASATPTPGEAERARFQKKTAMALTSTYVVTAKDRMPLVADVGPWRMGFNWFSDMWGVLFGSVTSGMKYVAGKDKGV